MAKKTDRTSSFPEEVLEAFKALKEINPDASFLDKSVLSNVESWIDTGSMALNAIISGSLYKGIPSGRIIGFSGPEACGKTYIIGKILVEAQKAGRTIVVFDTENAVDKATIDNLGGDSSRVLYIPVETVEQCRNQASKFLDVLIKSGRRGQCIISIDSLGNLVSTKELRDVEQGKDAQDMGTRAKGLKSMLRNLTHKAAKADVPILFSNHIYTNPTDLFPSLVKQQSGGSGPLYLASCLVQLAKKSEKVGDVKGNKNAGLEVVPVSKGINGVTLRALTVKNRFAPPFLETEMYLNFRKGLAKYSGLLELALGYGAVTQTGSTYILPDGTKLGFYKTWRNEADIWDKILPLLEERIQKELQFNKEGVDVVSSNVLVSKKADEIADVVAALEQEAEADDGDEDDIDEE